jgi:NADPH:quinone reductase and related Zn-dependent oxidoreductases
LKVEEIETPSPDPGEVLVRVHAAAITRGELEWPVDRLPAIPSYELSGVVVGSGDEVYALTPFDRTAWLPSTPSSQPMCLHRSPCG